MNWSDIGPQERVHIERAYEKAARKHMVLTASQKRVALLDHDLCSALSSLQGTAIELDKLQQKHKALKGRLDRVLEMNADLNEENSKLHEANESLAYHCRSLEAVNYELKRPWHKRVWFSLLDRIPFRLVWR